MAIQRPFRHVLRNKIYARVYDMLAKPGERQIRVFPTIKDLLCFAAFVGFAKELRVPLPTGETEDIQEQIFSRDEDAIRSVLLVSLAGSESMEIFHPSRTEAMVRVFEEYAHGGIQTIAQWLDAHPTDLIGHEAIIRGLRGEGLVSPPRNSSDPGPALASKKAIF